MEYAYVGKVVSTHGIKGEIRILSGMHSLTVVRYTSLRYTKI